MTFTPPFFYRLSLTVVSSARLPRRVELLDVVPESTMKGWAAGLYILCNIAWGYVDTVCDLCILARTDGTKPLVREVRALRRSYDQFRATAVDDDCCRKEADVAELFEEYVQPHLKKLFNGLDFEASKAGLKADRRTLVIAVHQAMTIIDAVFLYAAECIAQVNAKGYIFKPDCMVQDQIKELARIIPKFAGADYDPKSQTRKLSARIILNQMLELDVEPYWEEKSEQQ